MIAWRPIGAVGGLLAFMLLLVALTGTVTGDMAGTWREVRGSVYALLAIVAAIALVGAGMSVLRIRARAARELWRYEILLAQADEAPHEEVWQACDTLVKTVRTTLVSRLCSGQPWIAFELWHDPPRQRGETGHSKLLLLCEQMMVGRVIGTLRRISPNISVRTGHDGSPRRYAPPHFAPEHVLRVSKDREWELPITGLKGARGQSNARSAMASIIRAQQQLGREGYVSCVRVCIMPCDGSVDRLAGSRLRRMADRAGGPNAAVSADIMQAQQAGGGSLSFVELQAAVQGTSDQTKGRSYSDLQTLCQALLSPAMSNASVNTLTERHMYVRQRMYQRRWARATPPLIPDQGGSTLMWPIEVAYLIEPANLASEFDLPIERYTVPYLPAPPGLPRATLSRPFRPPPEDADDIGGFCIQVPAPDSPEEVVDGEIVG